jgi:hypothetical protein
MLSRDLLAMALTAPALSKGKSALLHLPTCDWTEGWRSQRLSAAQIKTGVMPGATHRVADHKSLGEGTIIVSTVG